MMATARGIRQIAQRGWWSQVAGAALLALTLTVAAGRASGADEAFVGVLALAVDPKVAKDLGIADDVRDKLVKLVDERENEAIELALQVKDLSPAERAAKLQPFVAESETKGFALLSETQRRRLKELRVERAGLSTLGETAIAEAVGLSDEQRDQIAKILKQRAEALGQGAEQERRVAQSKYERELATILSADQRKAWDKLAGLVGDQVAKVEPTTAEKGDDTKPGDSKTDDSKTPSTKSGDKPSDQPDSKTLTSGSTKPGDKMTASTAGKSADGKLYFKFRYAPWKDVLDWLATQADMSLLADQSPPGTFNYTDTRGYTPSESIDLLNGALLLRGYMLIRRERQLILLNLEDPIPDPLVDLISIKELDARGKYELITVVIPFTKWSPEEAEKEITKLISPNLGKVNVLPQARQIIVRDTVGRLKIIRDVVQAVENPPPEREEKIEVLKFEHIPAEEFLAQTRALLGLPENTMQTPDGSLKLSLDIPNKRILATGKMERIEKLQKLKTLLDDPSGVAALPPAEAIEQPQLEVYPTAGADPAAVLQVMQTLFAGITDVRLATDPKTGNLVALAKPSQHGTIRATLQQLQRDASQVEVFTLRRVDPQVAVLAINKLFGVDEKDSKSPGTGAPRVESDSTSRQLFVRGTPAQVAQVKMLLQKMGETDTSTGVATTEPTERGNVRTLPLSGRAARSVLEEVEALWPVMRGNRIRIVKPAADLPQLKLRDESLNESADPSTATDDTKGGATPSGVGRGKPSPTDKPLDKPGASPTSPAKPAAPAKLPPAPRNANTKSARADVAVVPSYTRDELLRLVAWQDPATAPADVAKPAAEKPTSPAEGGAAPVKEKAAEEKTPDEKPTDPAKLRRMLLQSKTAKPNESPSDIIVIVGPRDITIASEDLDALDAFEELLRMLADRAITPGGETTVFYLRYATADAASALLQEVMSGSGGGDAAGGGGGGGSLFGDIASSMMGDMGGGLLGSLLGGGGAGGGAAGGLSSGTLSIIPDPRLNALFVKANSRDLETIEQLLKIIDQEGSPEDPQTGGRPRFIQIYNTTADKVATVVRQVFASRIAADTTQPRQPSPEDLVRALRGGGGRQGGAQKAKSEPAKMTLGVDVDSNMLIVAAPEPLFQEVKALVEQLDHHAEANRDETIRTVVVKGSSPAVMQRALQSLLGPNVRVGTQTTGTTTPGTQGMGMTPGAMPNIPGGGRQGGFNPQMIPQLPGRTVPGGGGFTPGGGGFNPGGGFGTGGGGGGRGGRGGGRGF